MITKYHNLGDDVLEAKAEEAAVYSPLIRELLVRWQKKHVVDTLHPQVECPVCEAPLMVEADVGNDRFELTKDNP